MRNEKYEKMTNGIWKMLLLSVTETPIEQECMVNQEEQP
jgi:hypothetical protein